jgi:hypothetical protein
MGSKAYIGVHVRYPLFFSDFNESWVCSTDFRKILKFRISWKSVQWEPSCSMRTDVRTDLTKLIVAFRSFAKASKNYIWLLVCLFLLCVYAIAINRDHRQPFLCVTFLNGECPQGYVYDSKTKRRESQYISELCHSAHSPSRCPQPWFFFIADVNNELPEQILLRLLRVNTPYRKHALLLCLYLTALC